VNIDSRIQNPDQRITQDIQKFSESFATLYSNITKPLLDILLFTQTLSKKIGFKTVCLAYLWYSMSALVLKFISPPMGIMTATIQNHEGEYRNLHSNIKNFSE